jgi:hypothetical protein
MKTVLTLPILIILTTLSLSAMDTEVKREFTVTQIMLDLQKGYRDEIKTKEEDLNTSNQQNDSIESM